ncbi:hypothetical protein EDD11_002610 [Mortierella claussenii]|nr:hypothetical protein EDD11_002610 [Mortierella claussenii]
MSVGSEDSFVSTLSHTDSPKEPGSPRTVPLWKQMLDAIDQEDRAELNRILHAFDFAIVIQTLVTWNVSNTDNKYRHDTDVLLDAKELLGPTVDHLNLIQIACFLFNEEMALDLLNFVAKASDELESKKILYEFMGKLWGDGNTTLHLASFLGMADLTKRLLDLGANVYKMNDRKYKPVDCADENTTRSLFLNLTEVVRYRRIPQESLPTSPVNDVGPNFHWSSLRSMGHLRSPSTSTLPLLRMVSENLLSGQSEDSIDIGSPLVRPASTLGIATKLNGLSIAESKKGEAASKTNGSSSSLLQTDSKGSSLTTIDDLLLTDTGLMQQEAQEEEEEEKGSTLSPMVTFKSTATLPSVPSIPDSSRTPELEHLDNNDSNNHRMQRHDTTNANAATTNPLASGSSYTSHIRPKLRSYQSSPSIRLYAEKQASKETNTLSVPKKIKSTKRVSFDPQSLMADASRTGDLSLYKSMLAAVQEKGTSGTLEEIINHQSASRKLSSLHLAASYNHLALCQFLVEMGANVNLTDMEGWTPMHCAAAEGHMRVFEFLAQVPDADLMVATLDGELIEDVVEDDDLRQKVIDIIELQSRSELV